MLKKIITTMLIISMFPINVFAASPQTKQMIHDTLSKYCIPPKKENCNPREEGKYDPNYDFCLCENDGMVYSKSERKCVEVPAGTYYQKSMRTNIPKKCEPGTYSGSGASSCTSCSPGQYASGYGNTGCEPCPAGKYASGSGNASCSSCWAGSFQPSSGQSTCKSCNSNNCETSDAGATSCYSRCGGSSPYCSSGSCVECTSDSHCYGSDICSSNSCVDYCSVYDCSPPSSDDDDDDNNTGGSGGENSGNDGGGSCYKECASKRDKQSKRARLRDCYYYCLRKKRGQK